MLADVTAKDMMADVIAKHLFCLSRTFNVPALSSFGETSRTFGERYREHLKAPSPINDHSNISGHTTLLENFSIVGREEHNLSRLIKESMYIRVNGPSLNKNIGEFHLPHLWDEVLNNSRELKLK